MRLIPTTFSLPYFLDELAFIKAALSANPDVAHLAQAAAEWITDYDRIEGLLRAAQRKVVEADAVVAVKDEQLDGLTSRVAAHVLIEAGGDRKSTFYRRFFVGPPSDFVEQALRRQCQRTVDGLVPELRKMPEGSPLRTLADPLAAASTEALVALDARSKAMGERGVAANEVLEWKEGVNRYRSHLHAELLKYAAEKKLPRSWADTFFRRSAPRRAAEEEAEEASPDLSN